MKKVLLILAIALSTSLVSQATTETSKPDTILNSGDATIVKNGSKWTISEKNGEKVNIDFSKILDDTIYGEDGEDLNEAIQDEIQDALDDARQDGVLVSPEQKAEEARQQAVREERMTTMVSNITAGVLVTIIIIFLLALLFWYLHRRAKYRMVEKAIENNYPLPPSMGGPVNTYNAPQNDAWRQPQTINHQSSTINQPQPSTINNGRAMKNPPIYGQMNWRAFSGSFALIAVGVTFMIVGAEFFILLVLLGVGKAFITYQEQQSMIKAQQWQMQQAQMQPQQPPMQPQQPPMQPQQPPMPPQQPQTPPQQPQAPAQMPEDNFYEEQPPVFNNPDQE